MRNLSVFLCMTVMVGLAGFAAAGQGFQATLDPADGWEKVSEGYWQRLVEDGKVQTVAYGTAGLEKVVAGLKDELVTLVDEYLAYPNEDMQKILRSHLDHIAVVERNLEQSRQLKSAQLPPPALAWCDWEWEANAGGVAICTNFADAHTSYYGSSASQCLGQCALYAYAYTRRQLCNYSYIYDYELEYESSTFNDEVNAEASLSSSAARACYSRGRAYISCSTYSYYQEEDVTSTSCGLCLAACVDVQEEEAID